MLSTDEKIFPENSFKPSNSIVIAAAGHHHFRLLLPRETASTDTINRKSSDHHA